MKTLVPNWKKSTGKVQLINAPLAPTYCPGIRAGAFPPLHLASLAAFVRQHCPEVAVELLDGEVLPVENIISRLDGDLVGISCNSLTYESSLRIAMAANQRGALVVLGGAHPTLVGQPILSKRPFVDAIVCGDGEQALLCLVQGRNFSEIPNLIYREGDNTRTHGEVMSNLEDLPYPDYSGLDLQAYFRNYRSLYADKPFQRAFAAYSAKGCQWRDQTGGCIFCCVQHKGFRIKSTRRFWQELQQCHDIWGADFFWDVSDTFTMQREWVRQLASEKPSRTGFQFQVYGRTADIDHEMASLLRRIGVYEVFLGLESGSNATLRSAGKGASLRSGVSAIRQMCREDIRVVISIVLPEIRTRH